MRISEWILAVFPAILAMAAWIYPLASARRWAVTGLAAFAITGVALARLSGYVLSPTHSSILRDWMPVALMIIPYWQTGRFFVRPDERVQAWLVKSDDWFLERAAWAAAIFGPFARLSMEWAYALCYPLVPLGLATLCAAGLRRHADAFWLLVLVPTYVCYTITPFVPALPPRSLDSRHNSRSSTKSRGFNLWILRRGSIQAVSFPSAHVASSLAVALALIQYLPLAGSIFLFVAVWIAIAAVVGRYHYAIDVVLGAAVTLTVFLAWHAHLIPGALPERLGA
jgi:membrane-associated phospholipid phosphatase